MKFVLHNDDPSNVHLQFKAEERKLINRSLLKFIIRAATEEGRVIPIDSPIIKLSQRLLEDQVAKEHRTVSGISKVHINAIIEALTDDARDQSYDDTANTYALICGLNDAVVCLDEVKETSAQQSEASIERTLSNFTIPDTIDGLLG